MMKHGMNENFFDLTNYANILSLDLDLDLNLLHIILNCRPDSLS